MKSVDLLIIPISNPMLVGVYHDKKLIKTLSSRKKTSTALPNIFKQLNSLYHIENLYYVKGPGSFMAIKVAYIFLSSVAICKDISLFATDGFAFNKNRAIKAIGNRYFMKENGKISIVDTEDIPNGEFALPKDIDNILFDRDCEPLYILPAV